MNIKVLYEAERSRSGPALQNGGHLYWMKGDKRHGSLAPYVSPDDPSWKVTMHRRQASHLMAN